MSEFEVLIKTVSGVKEVMEGLKEGQVAVVFRHNGNLIQYGKAIDHYPESNLARDHVEKRIIGAGIHKEVAREDIMLVNTKGIIYFEIEL